MKISALFLFLSSTIGFAQSIILDPKTTAPTEAKVVVNGTGPAQSLWGPYYPISSERMGIKAVAPPTSGTKTTAIAGIVDVYSYSGETGEATGVLGFSASKTNAFGVKGIADGYGSGSNAYGVYGFSSSVSSNTNSYGGFFSNTREGSTNSNGYGIYASTYQSNIGTGQSYGGYFSINGQGISNKTGVLARVNHVSASSAAVGAIGFQTDISGLYSSQVIGLYSNITSTGNSALFGAKLDYTGVAGNSANIYGIQTNVKGTGAASYRYGAYFDVDGSTWNNSYGIYARSKIVADAGAGNGINNYGGYFVATGSSINQFGIFATSDANIGPNIRYAGYFQGNVAVAGTLTKSSGTFKIDHPQDPENKYLYHSFVESPDMKNIYDGTTQTDASGEAVVQLPAYFESLNKDFRYQLTPIGQFAQAIVAQEISNNQFKIKTNKPNVKISWQVTGIRQDAFANANRVVVEVDKTTEEKGKYLHPEVYGKDKTQGMSSLHELKPSNQK